MEEIKGKTAKEVQTETEQKETLSKSSNPETGMPTHTQ